MTSDGLGQCSWRAVIPNLQAPSPVQLHLLYRKMKSSTQSVPTGSLQSPSQLADVTKKTHICPFQASVDKEWLTLNECTKPEACHFSFSACKTVHCFAPKLKVSYFTHSANILPKAGEKREVFIPAYINLKGINRNYWSFLKNPKQTNHKPKPIYLLFG